MDKAVFTPEPLRRNDTLRRSLQRRVSMKVLRKKMKKFQDYSLPYDANFKYLNHLTLAYKSQFCRACKGSKVGFSIYFIITGKGFVIRMFTAYQIFYIYFIKPLWVDLKCVMTYFDIGNPS